MTADACDRRQQDRRNESPPAKRADGDAEFLTHTPISAKAKNQPGIVQCGWPRPPQSGVSVNRAIGGRLRQSRNRRRRPPVTARARQARDEGREYPGRQKGDLAEDHRR